MIIVCDTSGSMLEGGKRYISRNMVRATVQYLTQYCNYKQAINLVVWGKKANIKKLSLNKDVPESVLDCSGLANVESLVDLLRKKCDESLIIIVSDCYWSEKDWQSISEIVNSNKVKNFAIIKTGEDANPRFSEEGFFGSDSIIEALHHLGLVGNHV